MRLMKDDITQKAKAKPQLNKALRDNLRRRKTQHKKIVEASAKEQLPTNSAILTKAEGDNPLGS